MNSTYVDDAVEAVKQEFPDLPPGLLYLYALLLLVKGTETSNQDVHDAWALWRMLDDPTHRSIIPYEELAPEVQELDTPYAGGIRKLAGTIWSQKGEGDEADDT